MLTRGWKLQGSVTSIWELHKLRRNGALVQSGPRHDMMGKKAHIGIQPTYRNCSRQVLARESTEKWVFVAQAPNPIWCS